MKVGVYTTEAGYLATICTVAGTEESILSVADNPSDVKIVDSENLPTTWRDAWQLSGNAVVIGGQKAVEVTQNMIRQWRVEQFSINDIAIQNALVDGDEEAKTTAVARRNWLRDLPQSCGGKTREELEILLEEIGIPLEV